MKERETVVRMVAENLQTVKEKREHFFKELHTKIEELDSKQKGAKTWPLYVHSTQDQQSFSWIEADRKKKTTKNRELYNWVVEQKNTDKSSNNTDKPAPSNTQDVKKTDTELYPEHGYAKIHDTPKSNKTSVDDHDSSISKNSDKSRGSRKPSEKKRNSKKIYPRDLRYPPLTKSKVCQNESSDPSSGDSSIDYSEPSRYKRCSPNQLFPHGRISHRYKIYPMVTKTK